MNKIQECVEKLLEVIREDSAYQRYLACEEKLKSNPELKKQIDEFRVAVFHMNNDDHREICTILQMKWKTDMKAFGKFRR